MLASSIIKGSAVLVTSITEGPVVLASATTKYLAVLPNSVAKVPGRGSRIPALADGPWVAELIMLAGQMDSWQLVHVRGIKALSSTFDARQNCQTLN